MAGGGEGASGSAGVVFEGGRRQREGGRLNSPSLLKGIYGKKTENKRKGNGKQMVKERLANGKKTER